MVKYLMMDVDGSLTDGKIYIGNSGEVAKAFSVKDGYAIKHILRGAGIEPVIITARKSQIVARRCKELGIKKICQGNEDKLRALEEILPSVALNEIAYFGDDILDLKCMILIKQAGGVIGCPSDAAGEVKVSADFVCTKRAGDGALREFVEWLVHSKEQKCGETLQKRVEAAIEYLQTLLMGELKHGNYMVDDNFYYIVQEYRTRKVEECRLESHQEYVDIQWIIQGEEAIEIADIASLQAEEDYDRERDVMFWKKRVCMTRHVLREGSYIVIYPREAHMSCVAVSNPTNVKKIVGKVRITL